MTQPLRKGLLRDYSWQQSQNQTLNLNWKIFLPSSIACSICAAFQQNRIARRTHSKHLYSISLQEKYDLHSTSWDIRRYGATWMELFDIWKVALMCLPCPARYLFLNYSIVLLFFSMIRNIVSFDIICSPLFEINKWHFFDNVFQDIFHPILQ